MATVSALIPRVQKKGHSIPSTTAELELRDTVRRLCITTGIWTHTIKTEVGVPIGTVEFFANPSSGDYLTLDDGTNSEVTLTFGTDVAIGASATATMTNLITAIGSATLDITATVDSVNGQKCWLVANFAGSAGNNEIEYSGSAIQVQGMSSALYRISLSGLASTGAAPVASKILLVKVSGSELDSSQYVFDYSTQLLSLEAAPDTDSEPDGLEIKVEVEPAITGSVYPDWLVGERYADAIVGGALNELMTTPGRPYTDFGSAVKFKRDYELGICQARADRDAVFTTRNGSWVAHESNSGGLQG